MEFQEILYSVEDGSARIVLNRPDKRNSLSDRLLHELHEALWEADLDSRVHAVCLSGAGSCFSAGYKLSGGNYDWHNAGADRSDAVQAGTERDGTTIDDDCWHLERAQRLRMALFDMHKPVIAKVHGYCLAGGTDLALLCDMVIAADDAGIGFPPARNLGTLPNNMWLYNCGPQWAKRITLTGDLISGKDAAKIGLVMKSVPSELLDQEVDGLLARLALIDPELLSANKRIINLGLELMGARTLQRLAAENDARGHLARTAEPFRESIREHGPGAASKLRDAPFGDSVVLVDQPEIRDAEGRLIHQALEEEGVAS